MGEQELTVLNWLLRVQGELCQMFLGTYPAIEHCKFPGKLHPLIFPSHHQNQTTQGNGTEWIQFMSQQQPLPSLPGKYEKLINWRLADSIKRCIFHDMPHVSVFCQAVFMLWNWLEEKRALSCGSVSVFIWWYCHCGKGCISKMTI